MNAKDRCDESALRLVLDQPSSDARYVTAVEHVEACSRCQRRLEESAADKWWWTEGREILQSSAEIQDDDYPSSSCFIAMETWTS